jgi:hypothetical protein
MPYGVYKRTPENTKQCWKKGDKVPTAGQFKKGHDGFGKNIGENNWNWKGDKVSYYGMHAWIYRKLGKAKKCYYCGKLKTKPYQMHWANIDHKYKRDIKDYISLCVNCHLKHDRLFNNKYKK